MIIRFQDISKYQRKGVLVDGCFDPLHEGHIEYFKKATSFGHPVFCSLENDSNLIKAKHRPPLLPEDSRIMVLDAIRYIDFVFLNMTSTADILRRLKPLKYLKGNDWRGKLPYNELKIAKQNVVEIEFLDTVVNSSTKVIENYEKRKAGYRLIK